MTLQEAVLILSLAFLSGALFERLVNFFRLERENLRESAAIWVRRNDE